MAVKKNKQELRAEVQAFNNEKDPQRRIAMVLARARASPGVLSKSWELSLDKKFDRMVRDVERELQEEAQQEASRIKTEAGTR